MFSQLGLSEFLLHPLPNRNNKYWDTARFLQVVLCGTIADVEMIMQTALKSSATSIVFGAQPPFQETWCPVKQIKI